MTATETLRALLDEREVDWEAWNDRITVALPDTHYLEITDGTICAVMVGCTPEQAVNATLGTTDELDEKTMTALHDRLNAAMLALERADGDTEARVNAIGDAHEVLAAAEEMRRGTCKKVRAWEDDPRGGGGWVLVCSECDEILANDGEDGEFDGPNYCPNCGREVVE